ncbi:tubulin-tyrosine ligase [Dendrothele bispora CBS 962.96]|uniref:Tubulin-tyrosine ligase n=1 Tax=Dendrothele bispora (strain CBS 962.96) TaxID=1314807 RepID=A0A4S8LQP8_DENBC|nr:tubulin-tyrosine ligase [Dendrothele bispora CBS 962.96]
MDLVAFVSWPSASLTYSLVSRALASLNCRVVSSLKDVPSDCLLLQWSSYDEIDHEITNTKHQSVLASSYTFRKALIRKHFLSRCIFSYLTKHPNTLLRDAWPKTYELEISFADELDEMFADDLWELAEQLQDTQKWWILKPGMADRGNGIRMFNNRKALEDIFSEFEEDSGDEEDDEVANSSTAVVTSQLRHFVIQEYLSNPMLLDPSEKSLDGSQDSRKLKGHKFHLRAYCVASRALEVYLYDRFLALFSAVPYINPRDIAVADNTEIDLSLHLTNTCLQVADSGEEGVRLFQELIDCHIFSDSGEQTERALSSEDILDITNQMSSILSETFRAALENPINFQTLPNAFELFGVDFLVTSSPIGKWQVSLLEMNAEPAIEMTGPRLTWILEDLFSSIAEVVVAPFFSSQFSSSTEWPVGTTRKNLIKCMETRIRE